MFRILIVDDERIILNGIRMMIEEELKLAFPTDIVTASNAPQALELLEYFRPDLILTDIRMPVMDGFELIRRVREKSPSMNIAILTSHADFAYAQQAIRFQVTDFILKPVDPELLKAAIEGIYRKKKESEQASLRSALLELRNMMLYDLAPQELTSPPEVIGQLFPYGYFTVIVLAMSRLEDSYPKLLGQILDRYYDNSRCFLLRERSQLAAVCNHARFLVKPVSLGQEFAEAAHCGTFYLGVSISASSYKALHSLYVNAVQRVFYTRHFGADSEMAEMSLFTYQDCVRIFLENDEAAAGQLLEKYLISVRAASGSVNTPEMIYRSFFHNILLYLENNGISRTPAEIAAPCPIREYRELLPAILGRLRAVKKAMGKEQEYSGNEALARKLISYIREHYPEDVSLDDLADHVGLHPNYVCTVFKKNIGQSYLECLHRERLKEAKRLLLETDLSVEQIGAQVGYNSASQFARVFKKYESVSPTAFRYGK